MALACLPPLTVRAIEPFLFCPLKWVIKGEGRRERVSREKEEDEEGSGCGNRKRLRMGSRQKEEVREYGRR